MPSDNIIIDSSASIASITDSAIVNSPAPYSKQMSNNNTAAHKPDTNISSELLLKIHIIYEYMYARRSLKLVVFAPIY